MPIKTPTSFTAGRRVVLNGTTYQPGDAVPNAVVKAVAKLSALVSRRILVPSHTLRQNRSARVSKPSPNDISPKMRAGL